MFCCKLYKFQCKPQFFQKSLHNSMNEQENALSTKIKLKMLTEMFSDVDKLALRELFRANK